jgi:hypothetical protein
MKISRLFFRPLHIFFPPFFTPNILGILSWAFVVFVFSVPEALRARNGDEYKITLFAILTSILFIWAILNDYSEILRPLKKWFITIKIINYLVIPLIVIFSVVKNGIFQMRVSGIDLNLSCIPVIFQMYLIIFLYEFISYLKKSCVGEVKFKTFKKTVLDLSVALLAFCNICFCMYFVVSWIVWYKSNFHGK